MARAHCLSACLMWLVWGVGWVCLVLILEQCVEVFVGKRERSGYRTLRVDGRTLLRTFVSCCAAAAFGLSWVWAEATGNSVGGVEILGQDNLLRLQVEVKVGALTRAELLPDGRHVHLSFRGTDPGTLDQLIQGRGAQHPLLGRMQTSSGAGEETNLVLELARPVTVLDESLLALADGRSRWEIVLSAEQASVSATPPVAMPVPFAPSAPVAAPVVSVPSGAVLSGVDISMLRGMLSLSLTGNESLTAEVAFQSEPPALAVELPGTTVREVEQLVAELQRKPRNPLVRKVTTGRSGQGHGQLVLELTKPMDLVDSKGVVEHGKGSVQMLLVPDGPVVAAPPEGARELQSVNMDETAGQQLALTFSGIQGAYVNVYELEGPSRVMVDFIGWHTDQIVQALERFQPTDRVVRAMRFGETRLGSARVELEMSDAIRVADAVTRRLPDARQEEFVVSLQLPMAGGESTRMAQRAKPAGRPVTAEAGFLAERDFSSKPGIVIRPVVLGSAAAVAADMEKAGRAGMPSSNAVPLLDFYQRAVDNDVQYKVAKAEFLANSEAVPQAWAAYLPVATFGIQGSKVRQNIIEAANASFPTGKVNYDKRNWGLTITQPVVKVPSLVKIGQANIAVEQARVNLLAAEQDLILRVARAYLNLLAAKDAVDLATAEREAAEKHTDLARVRFQNGLGTVVQLDEAEGRLALTRANEITATNQLESARDGMKEIVGEAVADVHGFRGDFEASQPQPGNVEPWIEAAITQNLVLQARTMAAEIATMEVSKQRAGYLPTVNLVGSAGHEQTTGSIYGSGQTSSNMELGLNLSLPLFEGGMTSSLVREASARMDQSTQEMDLERRRTEKVTRLAFRNVHESSKTLAALRRLVAAQGSALNARLASFKSGVDSVLAVMDAYRLYYSARRDYLKTRYDYLVNRLTLKQAVGSLSRNDLEDLAELL